MIDYKKDILDMRGEKISAWSLNSPLPMIVGLRGAYRIFWVRLSRVWKAGVSPLRIRKPETFGPDSDRITANPEVIPGQKSASGRLPLMSQKPVSCQLPVCRQHIRLCVEAGVKPSRRSMGSALAILIAKSQTNARFNIRRGPAPQPLRPYNRTLLPSRVPPAMKLEAAIPA